MSKPTDSYWWIIRLLPLIGLWVFIFSPKKSTEYTDVFTAQLLWFVYLFLSEFILFSSIIIAPYFLEASLQVFSTLNRILITTSYLVIVYLTLTQQLTLLRNNFILSRFFLILK